MSQKYAYIEIYIYEHAIFKLNGEVGVVGVSEKPPEVERKGREREG